MQRTPECFHGPLVAGKPQQNPHGLVVDVLDGLQREAQGLVGPDTPLASFGMMADLGGPREEPRRGALAQRLELIELDQLPLLTFCFRGLATGRDGLVVWLPACADCLVDLSEGTAPVRGEEAAGRLVLPGGAQGVLRDDRVQPECFARLDAVAQL